MFNMTQVSILSSTQDHSNSLCSIRTSIYQHLINLGIIA